MQSFAFQLAFQSKRFAAWEVELKKHEKYTEQYKLICQTVYDEYRRLKEVSTPSCSDYAQTVIFSRRFHVQFLMNCDRTPCSES